MSLKDRLSFTIDTPYAVLWADIETHLNPSQRTIIEAMETRGGEPLAVRFKEAVYILESSVVCPGDHSIAYDEEARLKRKKFPPQTSAQAIAQIVGAELMTETLYDVLQSVRPVDLKGSSWLFTPEAVRQKGGALYGECKFGRVFIGANGADSYYQDRGVRLMLQLKAPSV